MGVVMKIMIIGLLLSVRNECSRGQMIMDSEQLFPEHSGCNLVRNSCAYNAYCNDIFDVSYRSTLINNENYCSNVIKNSRENLLPINILFKGLRSTPFTRNNNYGGDYYNNKFQFHSPNVVVQSVDFSNNSYKDVPDITDLINLKKFNISHNMLTIAILSNLENLNFLQEIDFSYNVIETLDVSPDENPYKELQVLNLSHNSITVIPEAILYNFPKLEQLDLSHNVIVNINSMTFFGLKQIFTLNLSYNRIASLSQSLAKLHTLKQLYLEENNLSKILYDDIHSLTLLNNVDFSCNNIENIEKDVFNNMTQLSYLNLRNNHLKSLEIDMFANAKKLEFVEFSQNEITKLPIFFFKQKTIKHFSIAENKIEGNLVKGMFEGLKYVEKLDLSYQQVTSIDDAAFLGLENLNELLLNNNQISKLYRNSFKLLTKLIRLDLSHNYITNFTLNTEDLLSLEYLSLRNNEITHIEKNQLEFLNKLEFLDISDNKIISIEPNSFSLQPYLKALLINNNHLRGNLSQNTFNGLLAVPKLDLSYSFLTAVSNGSFEGMGHLNSINISHCSLRDISYNAFINTGNLLTLDLSLNQLTLLNINTTEMTKLKTLFLQNNLIQTIHENLFKTMTELVTLDLSHNRLHYLSDSVFGALDHLEILDVSNNSNLNVRLEIMKPLEMLKTLKLSGTSSNITFDSQQRSLLELEMSNAGVKKMSDLKLGNIINLSNLILSHNKIAYFGEDIVNMSNLEGLDLSYNKIKKLQPGSFIGCANLKWLNISHNFISNINYGALEGLTKLNVLDMSYNLLENLEDEKFYQMHSLEKLIVDYNKILYVTIEQFLGTNLQMLSIGGNPLPCKSLIKLKNADNDYRFELTALEYDKSSGHNYYGVSCIDGNNKLYDVNYKNDKNFQTDGDVKVLIDIRNILKDLTINSVKHDDIVSLSSILSNVQSKSTRDELNNIILILRNFSHDIFERDETKNKINNETNQETQKTNSLLERILKVIVAKNYVAPSIPISDTSYNSNNATNFFKNLKDLENSFILEKERIVSEFDDKITALSKKIEGKTENTNSKSSNFTEVCVALLLLIVVCCVAFYIYRSQILFAGQRHTRSLSTRQITDDMDNSNL